MKSTKTENAGADVLCSLHRAKVLFCGGCDVNYSRRWEFTTGGENRIALPLSFETVQNFRYRITSRWRMLVRSVFTRQIVLLQVLQIPPAWDDEVFMYLLLEWDILINVHWAEKTGLITVNHNQRHTLSPTSTSVQWSPPLSAVPPQRRTMPGPAAESAATAQSLLYNPVSTLAYSVCGWIGLSLIKICLRGVEPNQLVWGNRQDT